MNQFEEWDSEQIQDLCDLASDIKNVSPMNVTIQLHPMFSFLCKDQRSISAALGVCACFVRSAEESISQLHQNDEAKEAQQIYFEYLFKPMIPGLVFQRIVDKMWIDELLTRIFHFDAPRFAETFMSCMTKSDLKINALNYAAETKMIQQYFEQYFEQHVSVELISELILAPQEAAQSCRHCERPNQGTGKVPPACPFKAQQQMPGLIEQKGLEAFRSAPQQCMHNAFCSIRFGSHNG